MADRLGSSIAPIYVNFEDVQQLKDAVIERIAALAHAMLQERHCEDPFLNIGIASLKFARAYPVLHNELIRHHERYLPKVQPSVDSLLELMQADSKLEGLPPEELQAILFKMQVFQMGLATMDVNRMLPPQLDEAALIGLLASVGDDIITAARMRRQPD